MRENIPTIRVGNDYGDQVVRDGIILCFFMRRSHADVAHAVWRALQAYLRAVPPEALSWYASSDGDMLPLDAPGWEHIRGKMFDHPSWGAWNVSLAENPSCEAGRFGFDYVGRRMGIPHFEPDARATTAVFFSLPTEYLLEHGPAHLRTLALEFARELPFSSGYASLAFVSQPGGWYGVRRQLLGLLERYLGLDLYLLSETGDVIGSGARGAYWLTFLGQPLLGQLGGLEGLRQQLPFPEVSFEPMAGERLLLTLGEWPDAMDTQKGAPPPQYRALARLLEPYFPEEGSIILPPMTRDYMHRWLRRLCP